MISNVIIYGDLIKKALKMIEDVPMRWKAAVQEMLEQA
ncbi:CD1375 family protein [Paenibacillus thiaminolyticus]